MMSRDDSESVVDPAAALREQQDYYRARAAEYDQWWLRQGRYDRGAANGQWFEDVEAVRSALEQFGPGGRILELACGTGLWSEKLLPFATQLTAVDSSSEMLAINAERLRSPRVRYVQADLFEWRPSERFDVVFFAFWLSHVPPERFAFFWQLVDSCLEPGGRVFFVDSRRDQGSTAIDNPLPETSTTKIRRRLNDGREFEIFKVFYDADTLTDRLADLGWRFEIRETNRFFLYGAGRREP
jgi:SAM-dependent methyltransferase